MKNGSQCVLVSDTGIIETEWHDFIMEVVYQNLGGGLFNI